MNFQKNEFGEKLQELREKNGMTQKELAERLGITPQAISKWERGAGLPDVTLFPIIARVFNISVSLLFGEDNDREATATTFMGMPLIASRENVYCYSDKTVKAETDDIITFEDGSTADLKNKTVINYGKGEIRISEGQCKTADCQIEQKQVVTQLSDFTGIDIRIAYSGVDVELRPSKNGENRLEAQGSSTFISLLKATVADGILNVSVSSKEGENTSDGFSNHIAVYVKNTLLENLSASIVGNANISNQLFSKQETLKITGSGEIRTCNCEALNTTITGNGEIYAKSCKTLKASITGNGEISFEDCSESSKLSITGNGSITGGELGETCVATITGNGDIKAEHASRFISKITGCGDINVNSITEEISVSLFGSNGDVRFRSGNVKKFSIVLTGSGRISAPDVITQEADIRSTGKGGIYIGGITSHSVEKKNTNTKLIVGKRG